LIRHGDAEMMLSGSSQHDSPVWRHGFNLLTALSTRTMLRKRHRGLLI
jgi:3-oxoacyl-(acyl-carrier-protein) synthase